VAAETDKPIEAVNAVLGWLRWLQLDAGDSRAARARLRRAASAFDALLLAETHALIKAVRATGDKRLPRDADERLAVRACRPPGSARSCARFTTATGTVSPALRAAPSRSSAIRSSMCPASFATCFG